VYLLVFHTYISNSVYLEPFCIGHPVERLLITNATSHRQHNFIKVIFISHIIYMTACFGHITVIFIPNINIKMYTTSVCIHFYINGRPENDIIWSKYVALE
jgi:hypothetical protein